MTEWLKGCEICDAGLCAEMDKYIEKHNMSARRAAAALAESAEKITGHALYSADLLRKRYERKAGHLTKRKAGTNVPRKGRPSKLQQKRNKSLDLADRIKKKEKQRMKKKGTEERPEIGEWLKQLNTEMQYLAVRLEAAKTYLEAAWGLEKETKTDFKEYGLRLRDAVLALFPEGEADSLKVVGAN